jgi:hypothetical protein
VDGLYYWMLVLLGRLDEDEMTMDSSERKEVR